jgi:hypothetical protein
MKKTLLFSLLLSLSAFAKKGANFPVPCSVVESEYGDTLVYLSINYYTLKNGKIESGKISLDKNLGFNLAHYLPEGKEFTITDQNEVYFDRNDKETLGVMRKAMVTLNEDLVRYQICKPRLGYSYN